jgi:hypothetical protein
MPDGHHGVAAVEVEDFATVFIVNITAFTADGLDVVKGVNVE